MCCRKRYMACVRLSSLWQTQVNYQSLGEGERGGGRCEDAHSLDRLESFRGRRGIAGRCFQSDDFGSVQFESVALVPPFARQDLVRQSNHVSARPGGQIADDGGLDVDRGLHDANLS